MFTVRRTSLLTRGEDFYHLSINRKNRALYQPIREIRSIRGNPRFGQSNNSVTNKLLALETPNPANPIIRKILVQTNESDLYFPVTERLTPPLVVS